jgi:hypothetical protein
MQSWFMYSLLCVSIIYTVMVYTDQVLAAPGTDHSMTVSHLHSTVIRMCLRLSCV